ncbi:pilus assembly protein TadG-related protein [Planctomycetota bacterium]
MRWARNRLRRGMSLIWVAFLGIALIIMVGFSIDVGWVLWVAHQLQTTADAAALSGALVVREDIVAAHDQPIAVAYANEAAGDPVQFVPNEANLAEGDVVIGEYLISDKLFSPTLSEPNAVKAVARRTADSPNGAVPLIFGPIFGIDSWDVARYAIAVNGGGKNIGLIVLDPSQPKALNLQGNPTLDVDRRGIQVNSTSSLAAFGGGSYHVVATDLNITGDTNMEEEPGKLEADLSIGQRPFPDPLAWMAERGYDPPTYYAGTEFMTTDKGTANISNSVDIDGLDDPDVALAPHLQPGYYSGGIDHHNGAVILEPGIYVLGGIGLKVWSNADFIADGVMIYITGTGYLDLGGGGLVYITPLERSRDYSPYDPVPDGCEKIYEGISVWQDASGTPLAPSSIQGGSDFDINGMLYLPSADMELGGNGGTIGNSLICNTAKITGDGNATIDYDDKYTVPAGGAYLVE